MPKKLKKAIILLAAALAVLAAYHYLYNREEKVSAVQTTGVVEAVEANVSAKVAGKLVYIGFREGAQVKKGELIARLEDEDLLAAKRQAGSALSAETRAAAGFADVVRGAEAQARVARDGVENAKAGVARAAAQLSQAEKDLTRSRELFKRGIIAKADLDLAETTTDSRKADLDAAKAALSLSGSQVAATDAGLRKARADVATQAARVAGARESLRLQEARLSYADIYSPMDGVVEYRTLEEGEVVTPGQGILTLIDPKTLWVRIDLEQRYITDVKVGQGAELTLEGVPGKVFHGTVFDIGREGEFAVERDVTRGRQDIKTFRTRIKVDDPEGILKPGMTVLVKIPF